MFGATALKQSPAVPKMLPDHDDADHDYHEDHDRDGDADDHDGDLDAEAKFNAGIGEKLEAEKVFTYDSGDPPPKLIRHPAGNWT